MVMGKTVALRPGEVKAIHEHRKKYFKLHPDQKKYPGAIIEMPSLPNDAYHQELWELKGYRTRPEDLMPDKKVKWNDQWGSWQIILDSPTDSPTTALKCDVCGQECNGEFGLKAHKRKHDK